jgi:hypothetical protein
MADTLRGAGGAFHLVGCEDGRKTRQGDGSLDRPRFGLVVADDARVAPAQVRACARNRCEISHRQPRPNQADGERVA